eukprot:UN24104
MTLEKDNASLSVKNSQLSLEINKLNEQSTTKTNVKSEETVVKAEAGLNVQNEEHLQTIKDLNQKICQIQLENDGLKTQTEKENKKDDQMKLNDASSLQNYLIVIDNFKKDRVKLIGEKNCMEAEIDKLINLKSLKGSDFRGDYYQKKFAALQIEHDNLLLSAMQKSLPLQFDAGHSMIPPPMEMNTGVAKPRTSFCGKTKTSAIKLETDSHALTSMDKNKLKRKRVSKCEAKDRTLKKRKLQP